MKFRLMTWLAMAGLLIGLSGVASAQVKTDPGVARISMIHGDVSTQRGDSGDWGAAALNAPVVEGDRIQTGASSRTEIQLDYANILRLAERAQANVTGLSRTQIQVQLGQGLANYSVLRDGEADVAIDTPNMSLHPTRREGSYRIFVLSDQETQVEVRKGEADVATPQGRTRIVKGQMVTVRGTGNDTQYQIADARSKDDFDRWNNDRDNTIRNAQSWSRTNNYYVGSEDLDAYGRWSNVPDYGQVWIPYANSGWAPYRSGRWVWEPYWGWTWVSYEPWGWAPYHYGRWMLYGSSWAWWPGPVHGYRHYRPVWAPAYVSFFGFGHGGGFGASFGWRSVGWLPIGPGDHYYPWWGRYRSHFNVVNVTNITNVTNVYNIHNGALPPLRTGNRYSNVRLAMNDDRVRGGISTVSANDFGRGRPTPQPVSREAFRGGRMVAGNLPVVPSRESLLAGERRGAPVTGRAVENQRFFSTNRATQPRQSFDREAADVRSAIQRDGKFTPIAGNQRARGGEDNTPAGRPQVARENERMSNMTNNNARGGAANDNANQNWRRFGQPEKQSTPANVGTENRNNGVNRQPATQNNDWRRPNAGSPVNRENPGVNTNRLGSDNGPDARRAPNTDSNNQNWRRPNPTTDSTPRTMNNSTGAPASRDRFQREGSSPTQDRGSDWRRFPSMQERNNAVSTPSQNSAGDARGSNDWRRATPEPRNDNSNWRQTTPERRSDSGNWRQSAPRDSGREYSRPQLDMRQPIVTPRSSGPSGGGYSGGGGSYHGGGYGGGGGGNSGGGRSAPAPSRGNGGGGGQPHSSGGNAPHRGR